MSRILVMCFAFIGALLFLAVGFPSSQSIAITVGSATFSWSFVGACAIAFLTWRL